MDTQEHKRCSRCKNVLPLAEFAKDRRRRDGKQSNCKPCQRKQAKQWAEDNAERRSAYLAEYRALPSTKQRAKQRDRERQLAKYDLTSAEFAAMLEAQHGGCAICGDAEGCRYGTLCVDHDHNTSEVRGLLCDVCNRALGLLKDDPDILRAALGYMERHQS